MTFMTFMTFNSINNFLIAMLINIFKEEFIIKTHISKVVGQRVALLHHCIEHHI